MFILVACHKKECNDLVLAMNTKNAKTVYCTWNIYVCNTIVHTMNVDNVCTTERPTCATHNGVHPAVGRYSALVRPINTKQQHWIAYKLVATTGLSGKRNSLKSKSDGWECTCTCTYDVRYKSTTICESIATDCIIRTTIPKFTVMNFPEKCDHYCNQKPFFFF